MHLVLAVFLILTKQTCIPWNPPEDVIRELQTVNKVMFPASVVTLQTQRVMKKKVTKQMWQMLTAYQPRREVDGRSLCLSLFHFLKAGMFSKIIF